jgi:hypothetical protein
MEIKKNKLISVTETDLTSGYFYNDKITEIGDDCFNGMRSLIKVITPNVTKIGNRNFSYNAALTTIGDFPLLATAGSYNFRYNAALTTIGDFPLLATAGSYNFSYNAALTTIGDFPLLATAGDGNFRYNAALTTIGDFPLLATAGSYNFSDNAALTTIGDFPLLATAGSYNFSDNAALTTIGDFPLLATAGSYNFSYNAALTTIGDFPLLATAGDGNFSYNAALTTIGDFPLLATAGDGNFRDNAALTTIKIGALKFQIKSVDGSCFVVQKERNAKGTKIYTGFNLLSITKGAIDKRECYVAEKEGFYAHGDTVKQAIGDMQFKMVAEKLKKDPITKDTKLTVMYYRTITGACDFGCREFMDKHKIPYKIEGTGNTAKTVELKPMKASELLPLLEKSNAYGLSKFKQLITFEA